MINHAESFYVSSVKIRGEDLESCGITGRLLEQLRPLISLPRVARANLDELPLFNNKGSIRNEKSSR